MRSFGGSTLGEERDEVRGGRHGGKEGGRAALQERVLELPSEEVRRGRRGQEDDGASDGERVLLAELPQTQGRERRDAAETAAENQLPARHLSAPILSIR